MSGNAGNAGDAGWTFADRANHPFVDEAALLGHEAPYLPGTTVATQAFRGRGWSPTMHAWFVLQEVAPRLELSVLTPPGSARSRGRVAYRRTGGTPVVQEFEGPQPVDAAMVAALLELARNERADALTEILGQKDEFGSYFMGLVGASPSSHPATHRVVVGASLIALHAAVFFKAAWNLARPSEFHPGLFPPFEIPGHPSFPSGHATQARLIALCLKQVLAPPSGRLEDARGRALDALAARIARNREIAGVHTAQDSEAGRQLGAAVATVLAAMAARESDCPRVQAMFAAATAEWADRTPLGAATRR